MLDSLHHALRELVFSRHSALLFRSSEIDATQHCRDYVRRLAPPPIDYHASGLLDNAAKGRLVLAKALLSAQWQTVIVAFISVALCLICTYYVPVLTEKFIYNLGNGHPRGSAVLGLVALTGLMYVALNHTFWAAFRVGMSARNHCLTAMVGNANSGEIFRSNVVSVVSHDLNKIQLAGESLVLGALVIPSVAISCGLIISYLGWQALWGLIAIALLIAGTNRVAMRFSSASAQTALGNRERLRYVEFMLAHFEALQAQGLLRIWNRRLQDGRSIELEALSKINNGVVVLTSIFQAMPLLLVVGSIVPILFSTVTVPLGAVFATLMVLGTLQSSFTNLPRVVLAWIQGWESLHRVCDLLVKNTAFAETPAIAPDSMVPEGSICVVNGVHAADALLRLAHSHAATGQKVALVEAKPWIMKGSLWDNLTGFSAVSPEHVRRALLDVCLTVDPNVDLGSIALESDGNNVSGGQAQRIALARALVLAPDVLVIADGLRQLDGAVRALVFANLCRRVTTVIFSTHLDAEAEMANYEFIADASAPDLWHLDQRKATQRATVAAEATIPVMEVLAIKPSSDAPEIAFAPATRGLMHYLRAFGGGGYWAVGLALLVGHEALRYTAEFILTSSSQTGINQLSVVVLLTVLSLTAGVAFIWQILTGALQTSQNLYNQAVEFFMHARLSLVQATSKRRHYATLVHDQQIVDQSTGQKSINFFLALSSFSSSIIVTACTAPILVPIIVVLAGVYLHYAGRFRDVGRLLAVQSSSASGSLYSSLMELAQGVTILRVSGMENDWRHGCLAPAQKQFVLAQSVRRYMERWLCLRLELLGVGLFGFLAWFGQAGWGGLEQSPLVLGLALTYASRVPAAAGRVVRMLVDLDLDLISVERLSLYHYKKLDAEATVQPVIHSDVATAVVCDAVSFTYPGAVRPVFSKLRLRIQAGERVAIVAPTGSGKSTLVKLLLGMYMPSSGQIRILGQSCMEPWNIAQSVHYVPQRPIILADTVRDALSNQSDLVPALSDRERRSALSFMTVATDLDANPLSVPLQRLQLAACLLSQAPIIILDEATADLSSAEACRLMKIVLERIPRSTTVLLITHQPLVAALASRTITLT